MSKKVKFSNVTKIPVSPHKDPKSHYICKPDINGDLRAYRVQKNKSGDFILVRVENHYLPKCMNIKECADLCNYYGYAVPVKIPCKIKKTVIETWSDQKNFCETIRKHRGKR
jgi:hypothetical protein